MRKKIPFSTSEGQVPKAVEAGQRVDVLTKKQLAVRRKLVQKLANRVSRLEQFVHETLVKGIAMLAEGQQVSEQAVASGHDIRDFEIRILLLAALKHRPLSEIRNLKTRVLVALLLKHLDEAQSGRAKI